MNLLGSLSVRAHSQWGLLYQIQGLIPVPDKPWAGIGFWQLVRFWFELGSSSVSWCVFQKFVTVFPKKNVLLGWVVKAGGRHVLELGGKQKKNPV